MKFGTDTHGGERVKINDFGNPLTFHLAPPAGKCSHSSSEISQYPLDGLAQNFVQTFLKVMYPHDFGDPLT